MSDTTPISEGVMSLTVTMVETHPVPFFSPPPIVFWRNSLCSPRLLFRSCDLSLQVKLRGSCLVLAAESHDMKISALRCEGKCAPGGGKLLLKMLGW